MPAHRLKYQLFVESLLLFASTLCAVRVCSCSEGYEGAYCQAAVSTTSDLPLLVGLSTLLPVAAALVVIVAVVFIYTRLKTAPDITPASSQRVNNLRAKHA